MPTWDERFRTGAYPSDPEPAPLLDRYVDALDPGRALDVAAGTGRNAVALAEAGYTVDAVDQSREGLRITRQRAGDRSVADRLNCVQADVRSHAFPPETYDLIAISFYRTLDRLPAIKDALAPGACSSTNTTCARPTPARPARATTGIGSGRTSSSTPVWT